MRKILLLSLSLILVLSVSLLISLRRQAKYNSYAKAYGIIHRPNDFENPQWVAYSDSLYWDLK
jgi:hypothetical protein